MQRFSLEPIKNLYFRSVMMWFLCCCCVVASDACAWWMRCAREGGGSAWTARAPLVRFLTRERQKGEKTAEEKRIRAGGNIEARSVPWGGCARRGSRGSVQAEQRSAGLEPGEIRRACPVKNITLSDIRAGFNVALLCLPASVRLFVMFSPHNRVCFQRRRASMCVAFWRVYNRRIVRVYPAFLRESEPC